ncbi:hypothetical protein DFH09DRAFT_1115615 [Mycena vulgaris]|nr:hypothetical protein DFH09DRAFT_1115615 [Mycena vulgaris]
MCETDNGKGMSRDMEGTISSWKSLACAAAHFEDRKVWQGRALIVYQQPAVVMGRMISYREPGTGGRHIAQDFTMRRATRGLQMGERFRDIDLQLERYWATDDDVLKSCAKSSMFITYDISCQWGRWVDKCGLSPWNTHGEGIERAWTSFVPVKAERGPPTFTRSKL